MGHTTEADSPRGKRGTGSTKKGINSYCSPERFRLPSFSVEWHSVISSLRSTFKALARFEIQRFFYGNVLQPEVLIEDDDLDSPTSTLAGEVLNFRSA
jgi:hypothetical protein